MDIQADIRKVATRTGMVAIPAGLHADVDQFHYAPARRAGDFVFLSGIVACSRQPQPLDAEGFREELRRVFRQIDELLRACEARLEDVVELQMFHVLGSGRLALDKAGQLAAIAAVRDEFFPAPLPRRGRAGGGGVEPRWRAGRDQGHRLRAAGAAARAVAVQPTSPWRHSQAAPRTPLLSPCFAFRIGVAHSRPNTIGGSRFGTSS